MYVLPSEYSVQKAINIANQNVEYQTVNGNFNVVHLVVEHQTIINTTNYPRKFVNLPKDASYTIYTDLCWTLVDRHLVDSGKSYEYVFERDPKFNIRELKEIESIIDGNVAKEYTTISNSALEKKKLKEGLVGVLFLFFIPAIGFLIILIVSISYLASTSSCSRRMKKTFNQCELEIEKQKAQ